MRLSFCSPVRRQGTNFAVTRLICKSSVRIFWHVLNAIVTTSATSLIVRCWLARMISRTYATVSSVWEVDGLPGRGLSSKDRHQLLKREYHSIFLIDFGRTLWKLLAAIRMFQHQFSPDGNRNQCTHAAALLPPSWDATHTAGRRSLKGFHRVNAERYRPPVLHMQQASLGFWKQRSEGGGQKWSLHMQTPPANLGNRTNKCTRIKFVLWHIFNYQHVSTPSLIIISLV